MSIYLNVYIKTAAKSNNIVGWREIMGKNYLLININKEPRDGEANLFIISFFAKIFGVKKSEVIIKYGKKTKYKTLFISNIEELECNNIIKTYIV
jgi:uncharacterized protein (TIGR00251 family)